MGENEVDILMKDTGNSRTSNYSFKNHLKQEEINEETGDTFKLVVYVIDSYWWPDLLGVIPFARIEVTHDDDPDFKQVGYSFGPLTGTIFKIPNHLEYPNVNASKPGWKQVDIHWHSKKEVDIIMSYTGNPRTVNNQLLNSYPLLKQILTKLLF